MLTSPKVPGSHCRRILSALALMLAAAGPARAQIAATDSVEIDGRVDLLVVYREKPGTPQQKQARDAAMRAGAVRAIGDFHRAVGRGVPGLQPALTLNLVGVEPLQDIPRTVDKVGGHATILDRRQHHGADIVIAVHEQPYSGSKAVKGVVNKNYCGSPQAGKTNAFALVKEADFLGTATPEVFTAAHEMGHIFGAGHDTDTGQLDNCLYDNSSYGHNFIVMENGRLSHYGTLMAYRGARQLIFSNPAVTFDPPGGGAPMPAGTQYANNARAIHDSYRVISNYFSVARNGVKRRLNTGPRLTLTPGGSTRHEQVYTLTAAVDADAEGDSIAGVDLVWRGEHLACPKIRDYNRPPRGPINATTDYLCARDGDTFTWSIFLQASTRAAYTVKAFDVYGTYGPAITGTVRISP